MRRPPSALQVAGLGCALILAAGLLTAPGASAAATTHGATPTWTTYFYPLKVGWTCNEVLTTGTGGNETLTVDSVTRVKDGQAVTLTESSTTGASGGGTPSNKTVRYILTKSGDLVSEPSAGQLSGQEYQIRGDTIYPSVQTLLSGGSGLSRVRIDAPLAHGDLSKLTGVLKPHYSTLDMALELKQTGTKVAELTTRAGTFHHLLAVHSVLHSLDITDATHYARQSIDSELRPTVAESVTNTVWYAPGFGPVKVSVGGVTSVATGCGANTESTTTTTTTAPTTTSTS